ncbi:hypothetical protein AYI70_g10354 [Smittium culicis]|uniref:Uncharacterized protein n=1 Tax=Smittium culicis TaxID=133412 RepID=A0A1R1X720_9FUNG|nr:hypothetical protein AYI70_g10354 [Smittium culicis]
MDDFTCVNATMKVCPNGDSVSFRYAYDISDLTADCGPFSAVYTVLHDPNTRGFACYNTTTGRFIVGQNPFVNPNGSMGKLSVNKLFISVLILSCLFLVTAH